MLLASVSNIGSVGKYNVLILLAVKNDQGTKKF